MGPADPGVWRTGEKRRKIGERADDMGDAGRRGELGDIYLWGGGRGWMWDLVSADLVCVGVESCFIRGRLTSDARVGESARKSCGHT